MKPEPVATTLETERETTTREPTQAPSRTPMASPAASAGTAAASRPEILPEASKLVLETAYRRLLGPGPGVEPKLRQTIEATREPRDGLTRGQLAMALQQRLAVDPRPTLELAVAIEALHSASSLIRSLRPSDPELDPSAIQLVALDRIHRGYALLWGVLGELPATRRRWATQEVAGCLGTEALVGNKGHDRRPALGGTSVVAAARTRAVPPIRLALVLPAIVAGVTTWEHGALERLAEAWGLSRQLLDDLEILVAGNEDPNVPSPGSSDLPLGVDTAFGIVDRHLVIASEALEDLGEVGSGIAPLHRYLGQRRLELGARLESEWQACAGG